MRAPGIPPLDRRTSATAVARLSANDTYIASRLLSARVTISGALVVESNWISPDYPISGICHPRTVLVRGGLIGSLIGA